jgi:hypothetical protein
MEGSGESRLVKQKRLSELYGVLRATRPFPGKEVVREEVGRILGEQMRKEVG